LLLVFPDLQEKLIQEKVYSDMEKNIYYFFVRGGKLKFVSFCFLEI